MAETFCQRTGGNPTPPRLAIWSIPVRALWEESSFSPSA